MLILLSFIIWTIFWSFWSVLLFRLSSQVNRSIVKGILFWRSMDLKTKRTLWRKEMIPIFSWLLLYKKNKKISSIYIVLEISCWIVVALTYITLSQTWLINIETWIGVSILVFWMTTNWLLTLLLIWDIYTRYLHMPIRIFTFLWLIFRLFSQNNQFLYNSLISFITVICIFLFIYLWAKYYAQKRYQISEWMGEWDIWLGAIIWLLLPYILAYHNIYFSSITLSFLISLYFAISSITAILWYFMQLYIYKKLTLTSSHISFENESQSRTLPFFPGLIIGFRIAMLSFSFWR